MKDSTYIQNMRLLNFSLLIPQIHDRLPHLKAIVQYSGEPQQKIASLYSVSPDTT